MVPHLLVSVRDRREAAAAIAGGCDILDVKEPLAGALGRADLATIVTAAEEAAAAGVPVSAALGELGEWLQWPESSVAGRGRCTLDYVKLGLAQTIDRSDLATDWMTAIGVIQREFLHHQPAWIAVVYADWKVARAPSPQVVLSLVDELRAEHGVSFAGLLIDTYSKTNKRLLDDFSIAELTALRVAAHVRQLRFAVAGRLRLEDVAKLRPIDPDIVAIRSAACAAGSRINSVQAESVARFKDELQRCFESESSLKTENRTSKSAPPTSRAR